MVDLDELEENVIDAFARLQYNATKQEPETAINRLQRVTDFLVMMKHEHQRTDK